MFFRQVIDPYVKVDFHGIPADTASFKTKVVKNNGKKTNKPSSFFEISSLPLKLKFSPQIQHQYAFFCKLCNYVISIISRSRLPS